MFCGSHWDLKYLRPWGRDESISLLVLGRFRVSLRERSAKDESREPCRGGVATRERFQISLKGSEAATGEREWRQQHKELHEPRSPFL